MRQLIFELWSIPWGGVFRAFAYRASRNHTRTCWVLKCDIRKFFASIDQNALLRILEKYIADADILRLLREIIGSFPGSDSGLRRNDSGVSAMLWHSAPGKGLPLGNLTSQLLVNIYMSEFDQFVKHRLKAKYYIRYADDFIFLSHDRAWLVSLVPPIQAFLKERLKLTLHPDKLSLKTFASGVDFLGWVHFPDHRVLRTSAKRRMLVRVKANSYESAIASYEGLLKHGNVRKLCTEISRYRSK